MAETKATQKSNKVTLTPLHSRLGRTALGWGVRDLAAHAEMSPNTVARFERGEELLPDTIELLRETMEHAGVEFIAEDQRGGAGVRLAKRRR